MRLGRRRKQPSTSAALSRSYFLLLQCLRTSSRQARDSGTSLLMFVARSARKALSSS